MLLDLFFFNLFCISHCRKSGNIRKLHRKQQTQRNKEIQITTQQFVFQPQTRREKESNPYIQRNISVEHRKYRKYLILTAHFESAVKKNPQKL